MGAFQSQSIPQNSIHEFTVKDANGRDLNLRSYKGKVLIVVNVASKCGAADSNYTQLTQLHNRYKNSGLEILAFPCNQFKLEPLTSRESEELACSKYNAEYRILEKVRCNGSKAAPIYKFLKAQKSGILGSRIKWNFTKFLVNEHGHVIKRYSPTTSPLAFEVDIKRALGVA